MRVCDAARMNAYSKDLRVKVVDAVDRGIPRKEVTSIFGISLPTIERYLRRRRQTEDLTPKPSPGRTPTIEQRRALWEQLESNSAATLERHCELWEREHRAKVSISTMSRAIRKLGWSYKKECGSLRARRSGEKCLAREGKGTRSEQAPLRRRVRDEHLADHTVCQGA